MVSALKREIEIAGKSPQDAVVILLPLGIHGVQLPAQTEVGVPAHLQFVQTAGYPPALDGDALLY